MAAARWFGRGSLFQRRCAREAAILLRDAGTAAALGRTAEACRLYAREAEVDQAPDALVLEGQVLAGAGELDAAAAALRAAAERLPPEDAPAGPQLRAAEGDLRWRRDDVAGAIRDWKAASRYPFQRAEARFLAVKSLAAADPALGPAVRAYLLDPATRPGWCASPNWATRSPRTWSAGSCSSGASAPWPDRSSPAPPPPACRR